MASRNYYVILGVASNETEQGVRAAFRDLAKRYHPDRVGPSGAAPFRELVEAYETLGDAERRHQYDESLRRPIRRAPGDSFARDVSLRRDFAEVRPSEDALRVRFARNFTGLDRSRNQQVEELQVELAISEDEARRGAQVRLGIPVFARCARCMGHGCAACFGRGLVEAERPVGIDIPPLAGTGTTFVMPLSGLGVHNFYVRVRVRVERHLEPPVERPP